MQLTNDQIKAVSEWMKEHGIDEHLIGKFEGDWMKNDSDEVMSSLLEQVHEYACKTGYCTGSCR